MTLDNFPTTRPSFTANFARSQQMPPQFTFSRATPGTNPSPGTVTGPNGTFLSDYNTPRFAWKDGKCQGLLIEEGSTNRQTYSQDGTQWTLTDGTSKTNNQPGAPDSSSTAVRILSVYTGELTLPSISGVNASGPFVVEYDLAANPPTTTKSAPGVGGYNDDLHNCGVEVLANGWYRIWQSYNTIFAYSVYVKPDGATTFKMQFDTNQVTLYVDGSSTTGGYFWGGQFETLGFPTSYIPTSGSTATRASDLCIIQNNAWLDIWNTPGSKTIVCEGLSSTYSSADAEVGDGPLMFNIRYPYNNQTQSFNFYLNGSNRNPAVSANNPAVQNYHDNAIPDNNDPAFFKGAVTFQLADNKIPSAFNGTIASSIDKATSAGFFLNQLKNPASNLDNNALRIGGQNIGTEKWRWNGPISRFAIYNDEVSDETLEALTQ